MKKDTPETKNNFFAPRRIALLGAIAAAIYALIASDVTDYLSYQGLVDNEAALKQAVKGAPLWAALAYMSVYILAVAFSLPGAIWLSLAGGLMFGTLQGGFLIVVAATLGASCLFLAARYLVGDVLRARAGPSLQKFEANFNRDAVSYLLVLRLLPIFPFFIVNLGAALVGVRFPVFVVTTFIGILPGTFVFASIGNGISVVLQEGSQPDLSVVTRPEIILPLAGLAVLSLLPVIWRRVSGASSKP
ncbi:TVP38/TMEM64 family protein [Alphaproteobacteria bacterium]|nr:TVP38/TMEM64 family protein [Alphaproteobacteria bacterium]